MHLRSVVLRSFVAGICCLSLPSCLSLPEINTRSSFAALKNDLPQKTHNFAEVPFEESAKQVATWIRQHEFEKVEEFFHIHQLNNTASRGGHYHLATVYDKVFYHEFSVDERGLASHLDRWIEVSPNSSLAYLFRAKLLFRVAWKARTQKFLKEVPKERYQKFIEVMEESSLYLSRAYELDSTNQLVLLDMLDFGRSIGIPKDEYEIIFSQLIEQDPYFTPAYMAKAMYLAPQWSGSHTELMQFVRETMLKAPRGSNMPMVILEAHRSLRSVSGTEWSSYIKQPDVWADLEYAYTRLIDDFPKAGLYPAWYAELAMDANRDAIAKKYIEVALEREPSHPTILEIKNYINQ